MFIALVIAAQPGMLGFDSNELAREDFGGWAVPQNLLPPPVPAWRIRYAAIRVLRELGPAAASAVPTLIQALNDVNNGVRAHAADTLPKLGSGATNALPALIRLLQTEKDEGVQMFAAGALGEMGPSAKDAVLVLTSLLKSPYHNARANALTALHRLGSNEDMVVPIAALR